MLRRRKVPSCDDGTTGVGTCGPPCRPSSMHTSNKLFGNNNRKIIVCRAPVMSGLNLNCGLTKKFQRPMLKRRAYGKSADLALKQATLGQKKRMNGFNRLMARAGKPLSYKAPRPKKVNSDGETEEESDSDDEKEEDRPFEPLKLWTSPHDGGEPIGLQPQIVSETRPDEYGIEETVQVLKPAPITSYAKNHVFVPPVLAKWLRPHQREGVQFMYECVMNLKQFNGNGVILADDMGLGKTLQSVTLIYTLLKTGITSNGAPTVKRVIVICPCSLVKNWDNEFTKWLGAGAVKTLALAEADRKTVEKNIDCFVKTKMFNVLIASYECIRTHIKRLTKYPDCCDLLVCDEAHRLKNSENQTSQALNSLPVKRRVLLTGTPMQNDLTEFYAMVDFTNPGILGSPEQFRKRMLFPILRGREPDATDSQKAKMMQIQNDMSSTVNDFILRRVNTLNAQHLPPKLVQVVCCNLTEIQSNIYQHLVNSKDMQHVLDGKQVNCLASIQMLMKLCNHPSLVAEEDQKSFGPKSGKGKRAAATKVTKYTDGDDDKPSTAAPGADGIAKFLPFVNGEGGGGRGGGRGGYGGDTNIFPEWSGKMYVLYRLMKEMRKPGNGGDKIVIVSNYTQTLDLIGKMCRGNSWGFCRLDGSVTMKKRQKMVDEFNDPTSSLIAFLLSSKAGGCGLNLIGGNRLVLFDPDWNPAVDKQAAARCWRDGQKKRCFTYRFLATGTVEEKIFQRQLSKEGLQSVVDDKEQVNALSTKDLRNLFKLRSGTPSDTHDKLRCERCQIIQDNAEMEAKKVLPKKLAACMELLEEIVQQGDAQPFLKPLNATDHGKTKEEYEKLVKQPMDLETIRTKLNHPPENSQAYKSVSGFSKDVNRIFSNVMKVWVLGDDIADAARRLQSWWIEKWTELVPRLMKMKSGDDDNKDPSNEAQDPSSTDDILEGCANVHNERGDDYQEQIGMPDEENMRSWSHHSSSDTVDDPVFRAAMRGSDAVSFVFGLEVTWSLIQQRQQEEEERLALQELETMQELQAAEEEAKDENSDSGGDDTDDKTPDAEMATSEKEGLAQPGEKLEDSSSSSEDEAEADGELVGAAKPIAGVLEDSSSEEEEEDDDKLAETKAAKPAALELEDSSSSEDDEEEEELVQAKAKPSTDGVLEDSSSEDDEEEEELVQAKAKPSTDGVLEDSSSEDDDGDDELAQAGAKRSTDDVLEDSSSSEDDAATTHDETTTPSTATLSGARNNTASNSSTDDVEMAEAESAAVAAKEDKTEEDSMDVGSAEDDDDDGPVVATRKKSKVSAVLDVDSSDSSDDDDDDDQPLFALALKKDTKEEAAVDSMATAAAASSNKQDAEPNNDENLGTNQEPAAGAAGAAAASGWACSKCTYQNEKKSARKCGMCGARKPTAQQANTSSSRANSRAKKRTINMLST